MPCHFYTDPEGRFSMVMCSRGRKEPPKCSVCGKPATYFCDYPVNRFKTCDAPLCKDCRAHVGMDTDLCPLHDTPEAIEKIFKGGNPDA